MSAGFYVSKGGNKQIHIINAALNIAELMPYTIVILWSAESSRKVAQLKVY